ncbi:M1 family metallopeptidase [Flavobacterium rhizosphaerae]|uniref:M1 family metallopeptidase n=1 Tax=Flavobacterium rhizosphaerae TaxID=3163298 RepID=A0ABW8Z2Q3_9FLAO
MKIATLLALMATTGLFAQQNHNPNAGYWQQHVDYKMDVNMDVKTYKYTGTQQLVYTNNSPDTLRRVYYHLYPNAFQPGSEMDARLQAIADPDSRMVKSFKSGNETIKESRIATLKSDEIGYLNIIDFKQDGTAAKAVAEGTILEVDLNQPILPGKSVTFTLNFDGQVPLQVRRSGRNSEEGVALSMTQWYPKIAEYDFEGWHADPYIGREFFGVWGDFDVNITIDKNYTIGGSGYLQNGNEIGKGYQDEGVAEPKYNRKVKTLTWHFIAPNVHDFAWGADPDYIHDKITGPNGVILHFFYKKNTEYVEGWKKMQPKVAELLEFYNQHVGAYPYKQYSVVQGGDGGMEYAMCTLITGNRSYGSLVGVVAHEFAHSWFQHVLASNESKHEWMDEGFTSYISDMAMETVLPPKVKEGEEPESPFQSAYNNYYYMAKSGKEQPLTTHSDRYNMNALYSISAYSKGEIFLAQLGYVIGEDALAATLKRFYYDFKFTHPTPNDIKRTAEKVSGAELDWYLTDWCQTTNTIDYAIDAVTEENDTTTVMLKRIGLMPMPLDIIVGYSDGSQESFYVPLQMMHYEKPNPFAVKRTVVKDWDWAHPTYTFTINKPKSDISIIMIDPAQQMADVNKENNLFVKE